MSDLLAFDDSGGTEEPIVFINGLFQTVASWTRVHESVARYSRVLRVDLRNQGASPDSDGPCSPDRHAADLVALLDHLGCSGAHLVGHSYGTRIALRTARALGERARSLVLVGASAPALRERYLMIFHSWRRAILAGDDTALADTIVPWVYGGHYVQQNPGLARFYSRHLVDGLRDGRALRNLEGLIASYEEPKPALEGGGGIACRTVVLNGAEDAVTPPSSLREWCRSFFNASLVVAPDTGHAVVAERADLVEEAILNTAL